MIKVNLLPAEQGRRQAAVRRSSGPSPLPFYLLLFLLYAGAAAAGFFVFNQSAEAKNRVAEHTTQRDKLKAEVQEKQAEFEANNLRSQEIEEKYAVVETLGPQNRVFWSEKINMIAMARLNLAVYVTKIELEEQIDERETPESVRRREEWQAAKKKDPKLTTPEPQPVKQPIINQTLIINAIAYGNNSSQQLEQATSFYNNLRAFEWKRADGTSARFTDRLASEFQPLPQKADRVAGVDIMRFGYSVKADPQLDRTSEDLEDSEVAKEGEENTGPTIRQKREQEKEVLN